MSKKQPLLHDIDRIMKEQSIDGANQSTNRWQTKIDIEGLKDIKRDVRGDLKADENKIG